MSRFARDAAATTTTSSPKSSLAEELSTAAPAAAESTPAPSSDSSSGDEGKSKATTVVETKEDAKNGSQLLIVKGSTVKSVSDKKNKQAIAEAISEHTETGSTTAAPKKEAVSTTVEKNPSGKGG